jgi:hypothetical protein
MVRTAHYLIGFVDRMRWWHFVNTIIYLWCYERRGIIEQVSDYRLLKKNSVPCGYAFGSTIMVRLYITNGTLLIS